MSGSIPDLKTNLNRYSTATGAAFLSNSRQFHENRRIVLLNPPRTTLWSTYLSENDFGLGCDDQILTFDAQTSSIKAKIKTTSSIFALEKRADSLLLAGTRSGSIIRHDLRVAPVVTKPLLRLAGSLTNLRTLREWELVAATSFGAINMYDQRFVKLRPVTVFTGHSNQHLHNLAFDVFESSILAAAGQDCRVRFWSLNSGSPDPLYSDAGLSTTMFAQPITNFTFQNHESKPLLWIPNGLNIDIWGVP